MQRYLDMDFLDALDKKYADGVKKHRKSPSEPFTETDPIEALYQELLDAIHYATEAEQKGQNVAGYRTTLRNMALALQKDYGRVTYKKSGSVVM